MSRQGHPWQSSWANGMRFVPPLSLDEILEKDLIIGVPDAATEAGLAFQNDLSIERRVKIEGCLPANESRLIYHGNYTWARTASAPRHSCADCCVQ